jgi:predicted transposase/invertase (TIGR01784 family)
MKTDSLFYELFRHWPGVALELAGLYPSRADGYEFRSEEIKQTAFRLDGVLAPPENSDDPWLFVEVQFQPDDTLYRRLFAEIFLYLHRLTCPKIWRAQVIYPSPQIERIPAGYDNLLQLLEIQRIDLQSLTGQDRPTPGWDLLSLIVEEDDLAIPRARRLIEHSATTKADPTLINFIETILVYKLPRSTREEIQTMLGITDVDLKQTRFYQDVHAEGKLEGKAEGKLEGRRTEAAEMLKRLAQLRFGALPGDVHTIIASADIAQLEEWLERLLTVPNLAAIFTDSGH